MQFYDPNLPPPERSDSFQRKRSRDMLETDSDDCYPISKRINCLHIEHSATASGSDDQLAISGNLPRSAGNPESPPLHYHAHLPDCRDGGGCNSPDNPHVNGHSGLPFDQSTGMYTMYGGCDLCPQNGPHSFASGGLHSMVDCNGGMPHNPELLHSGGGLQLGQPCVENTALEGMACLPDYLPELSALENPHYYHINGLLHKAHWNRVNRFKNN